MPKDRLDGSGLQGHVDLMILVSYISDYSLMSSLYALRKAKTVGSTLSRLGSLRFTDH